MLLILSFLLPDLASKECIMMDLIRFYASLGFVLRVLVCFVLLVVVVGLTYFVVYVFAKHNVKKRQRLEMIKKSVRK